MAAHRRDHWLTKDHSAALDHIASRWCKCPYSTPNFSPSLRMIRNSDRVHAPTPRMEEQGPVAGISRPESALFYCGMSFSSCTRIIPEIHESWLLFECRGIALDKSSKRMVAAFFAAFAAFAEPPFAPFIFPDIILNAFALFDRSDGISDFASSLGATSALFVLGEFNHFSASGPPPPS